MATPKNSIKTQKNSDEKRVYKKDNRPSDTIFAERADDELRLMSRRFARLQTLGDAYKAQPTAAQLDKMEAWLEENLSRTMAKLRESLNKPADVAAKARPGAGFKLLQ